MQWNLGVQFCMGMRFCGVEPGNEILFSGAWGAWSEVWDIVEPACMGMKLCAVEVVWE